MQSRKMAIKYRTRLIVLLIDWKEGFGFPFSFVKTRFAGGRVDLKSICKKKVKIYGWRYDRMGINIWAGRLTDGEEKRSRQGKTAEKAGWENSRKSRQGKLDGKADRRNIWGKRGY